MEGCGLKEPVFKGSCTAMITPFRTNDEIDYERLKRQLAFQAGNGTSAVVIAGTTGENATLSEREYEMLAAFCVRETDGRMKVILGVGGNNTQKCMDNARFAKCVGADAVLMTPPYYNKTSPAGLEAHFLRVADAVDIPLILYNVPGRTAIGIPAESYRRLAEHPNINGVKESSGNLSLITEIAAECAGKLWIWSGNDDHTIAMMALGAQGVVSVAANLLPGEMARLCKLCLNGDFGGANALYAAYAPLMRALFVETNPIPVKAAMALLDMDGGQLRQPLVPISETNLELLKRCLENTGVLR